ncbi:MAG: 5-formyltetrahydrofolate cyclo-ligase [Mariniblastus sp.]|nr:5-formyltetrahydrofolate cyclo-ligase [Mariniblastus sp.]
MNLIPSQIRNDIRSARNSVSQVMRAQWSEQICERLVQLSEFAGSRNVAAFLAHDGEADPIGCMTEAYRRGKNVFVPVILGKAQPLKFAPWTPTAEMQANRFGILEPVVEESSWIDPSELDFVVTPLVAFDGFCNRIGMGGGYYDRTFSFLNQEQCGGVDGASPLGRSVFLAGFAFDLQKVDSIENQPWDVPLDCAVTEVDFYSP